MNAARPCVLAVGGLAFLAEQIALGQHDQAQLGQLEARRADPPRRRTVPRPARDRPPSTAAPSTEPTPELVLAENLPQALGAARGPHDADGTQPLAGARRQILDQIGDAARVAAGRA